MGIKIGGGNRKRRSYADYKPPGRNPGPRNDPFRIVFYLIVIGGVLWVYFNQDQVRGQIASRLDGINILGGIGESQSQGSGGGALSPGTTPEAGNGEGGSTTDLSAEELAAQGAAAVQAGQIVEAIGFYREAGKKAPNMIDYHIQATRLLIFQSAMEYGDQRESTLDEALSAANDTILADPERPEGYALLGKVYDWQGDPSRGLSEISRALEIDENYAVAYGYMAEALVDLTRWDQATEAAEQAVNLDPNNVDIRRDYAYVLESLADYTGAVTQYEAAIRIEPNLPYLQMALGRAYREIGRYQEAIDQFFAVQTIDPSNALIAFEVGRTYETYVGDPSSALEYYERAVELDAGFAFPWVRIGTIRYLQGSYPEAIVAFERAIALDVETATIHFQLGYAYLTEGNCSQAITAFNEARNLAEDDETLLEGINDGIEQCQELQNATPDFSDLDAEATEEATEEAP